MKIPFKVEVAPRYIRINTNFTDTVDIVDTVVMVYTLDVVHTVDMVYTVAIVYKYYSNCFVLYTA